MDEDFSRQTRRFSAAILTYGRETDPEWREKDQPDGVQRL